MSIAAGALRESINVERLVDAAKDSFGESVGTWTLLLTVRAQVTQLSGSDLVEAQQLKPTASLRVRMRWASEISDLSGDDRLVWGNRVLHIEGTPVNVDQRDEVFDILCSDKGVVTA